MNHQPIENARDADLRLSEVALQRAARRARKIAARTGTTIVISRNGVIEHVRPDVEAELEDATCDDKPHTAAGHQPLSSPRNASR
jgi:hypothetical protein